MNRINMTEIYVAMATNMSTLSHFDYQVLDDNLEKKKLSLKKNCVAMETKLFPLLK